MAGLPPPEGMTEDDYDAIHAAVVETVRGRWFLSEFARRSRVDEVREMLTAIGRLEAAVIGQGAAMGQRAASPQPLDTPPHMRLLIQRADEIAGRLTGAIEDLRVSGADDYLCDELETQVRAITALYKSGQPDAAPALPPAPRIMAGGAGVPGDLSKGITTPAPAAKMPLGQMPSPPPLAPLPLGLTQTSHSAEPDAPMPPAASPADANGRAAALAALAILDRLSLAEKLALFA